MKRGGVLGACLLLAGCCLSPSKPVIEPSVQPGPGPPPTSTSSSERQQRERAEIFKTRTQGSWRKKDFPAYIRYVATELRLKKILEEYLKREEAVLRYRIYGLDGFLDENGGYVAARFDVVPRWTPVIKLALESTFGIFAKLIPNRLIDRLAVDLAADHKLGTYFVDTGLPDVPLELELIDESGKVHIPIGTATTGESGRATLDVGPEIVAEIAEGAYRLRVQMGKSNVPQSWFPGIPTETDDTARVLVQRQPGGGPVLVVNVSNTLFDLGSARAISRAARKGQYEPVDACAVDAIASLRTDGIAVVFLSGMPEGITSFMRAELRRTAFDGTVRQSSLLLAPPTSAFKATTLKGLVTYFGPTAVVGYVGDDAEHDGGAAEGAGVPFAEFSADAGGWCGEFPSQIRALAKKRPGP